MRSERVTRRDLEGLARRWILDPRLACALLRLDGEATRIIESADERFRWPGIWVISGHRDKPLVPELDPTQEAATKSLHQRCPSLAVDLRVGNQPASLTPFDLWAFLGGLWQIMGLRWGGTLDLSERNHFDMGEF